MKAGDGFIGAWCVTESVYEPDGQFAGVVSQRRVLERADDERVRVIQVCEPDAALERHAMGRFRGRWVFELEREDDVRRYLGPDVVGSAQAFGRNAMVGRGFWPRFGHGFSSFSMLEGERQITGGCFYSASRLVARIVGVGVPDALGAARAEGPRGLHLEARSPEQIAPRWHGQIEIFVPGQERKVEAFGRTYEMGERHLAWRDTAGWSTKLTPAHDDRGGGAPSTWLVDSRREDGAFGGQAIGVALGSGPLLEGDLVLGPAGRTSIIEVLDGETQKISGLRRYFRDDTILMTEVFRLSPEHREM